MREVSLDWWYDPFKMDPSYNEKDNMDVKKYYCSYFTIVNPSYDRAILFMVKDA